MKAYKSMHEEIMREEWCTGGPLLELSILSYIPVPKQWKKKREQDYKGPSPEEIANNKLLFLKGNMELIKTMIPEIKIIEKDERIDNEINFFMESKFYYLDIKVYITIGYKRKGRLLIHCMGDSIILYNFFYEDNDTDFKCRNEVKDLFEKTFKLLNGFCGTIGLESGPNDIFKMNELLMQMGNGKYYGIEDVKWNMNYKWCRN